MTGQSRPVNHRSSKSFNGLGRFQPRELHKHLLRGSTAQSCDGSLNNFIRLGLGAVLRASVRHTEASSTRLGASVEQTEARIVARFGPDDCVVCRGGNRARSSGVRPWDRSDQGSSLWFHGCVPNAESRLTGQSADPTGGGAGRMGNQVPVGPVTLLVGRDALEHRDQRGDEGRRSSGARRSRAVTTSHTCGSGLRGVSSKSAPRWMRKRGGRSTSSPGT